jgi:stearoyl-CoA desaturase (delta-9 desaturase)
MPIFLFFIAHWFLSLFSQTFFHHRYAAHRMFTLSPFWERFFYLFTFVTQGSSFLVPRAYAVLHRRHHVFSDTAEDPHSPHFHGDPFRMMWQTKIAYSNLVRRKDVPSPQFGANLPEWEALDRFGDSMYVRILWGTLYSCFYIYFASTFWLYLLLPVHFLMGVFHGAIVNWCGHRYGYRNFSLQDQSKNTLPVDFLMLGELFQNNHHRFPNRVRFAFRWFEFDPIYPVIRLFQVLKILRLKPAEPVSRRGRDSIAVTV